MLSKPRLPTPLLDVRAREDAYRIPRREKSAIGHQFPCGFDRGRDLHVLGVSGLRRLVLKTRDQGDAKEVGVEGVAAGVWPGEERPAVACLLVDVLVGRVHAEPIV